MTSEGQPAKRSFFALCVISFIILSLALSACGSGGSGTGGTASTVPTPNPATPTIAPPTNLLTPGTLTVGSDTTYLPMEYVDTTTNQYVGFDVDLITLIAQRMGLKVKIVKTGFDTIFDDLSNKRFDTVISSVTINDQRKVKFDFVPYFQAGESLLVPMGNPKHITGVADLCGLNVSVQTGTVEQTDLDTASAACKKAGKPAINQTILQDQTQVIQQLVNHRVDATYQDSPITDYYNKQNPGQFEVGGSVVNTAPYGITLRKGDTELTDAINKAFQQVVADGSYGKLFDKWQFTKSQEVSAS
ncbi:MAG TPA: ABC transporter substrate-binding protein [Ktedonobacteraceae bacterium]